MTVPDVNDLADFQAKDSQQALDAALAQVQSYCGWVIAPTVTGATASVWSKDGCVLFVPTLNLTAVTSVTQDGVVLSASNYTFESYGAIRVVPGHYFTTLSKIAVVYTHGYATMPDDVASVILGFAQRAISDNRGFVARGGSTSGTFVETFGPALTDADKTKLAPYVLTAGFA